MNTAPELELLTYGGLPRDLGTRSRVKRAFRSIMVAFARRLLNVMGEAQAKNIASQLGSCGRNLKLFYPLCVYGAANITVGDDVSIGAFTHIWGNGGLYIGNRVMIASNNAITTLTHDHSAETPKETLVQRPIIIQDDVWIGTHSTILPGVTLGRGCVVGAGAVVTHDVEPYAIVTGVPATLLKFREIEAAA